MATTRTLRTVIFVGSGREVVVSKPKRKPESETPRVCDRVVSFVEKTLRSRDSKVGPERIAHQVTILDPTEIIDVQERSSSMPGVAKKPSSQTMTMHEARRRCLSADCFLVVSLEYNHATPPGLASLMGRFGNPHGGSSSNLGYKPCGLVLYSTQNNVMVTETKATMALRPFLNDLGCLTVSKMCRIFRVGEVIDDEGVVINPNDRGLQQLDPLLAQLEWITVGLLRQREYAGEPER